jgi:hypothetical protein
LHKKHENTPQSLFLNPLRSIIENHPVYKKLQLLCLEKAVSDSCDFLPSPQNGEAEKFQEQFHCKTVSPELENIIAADLLPES